MTSRTLSAEAMAAILQTAKDNQGAILSACVAFLAGGVSVWYLHRPNPASQETVCY